MNIIRITAALLISFFFMLSCKRKLLVEELNNKAPITEEPKKEEPKKEEPKAEEPKTTAELSKKILIPVRLKSDRLTVNIKYEKNSAVITEITGSDDYRAAMTYKAERYIIMDLYTNYNITNSINFIFTGDKINRVNLFTEENRAVIPNGRYYLTYNNKDQITTIKNYGIDLNLFRESNRTYDAEGNLSGITTLDYPDQHNSFTYIYDKKNGIFKHVKFAKELFLEVKYPFFNAAVNNILSYSSTNTPSAETTFSYQYNSDGYPSKITIRKGEQQTFEITYAELKP